MAHQCDKEAKIAVLEDNSTKTYDTVQKIYKILTGNGEQGLVTQTSLNKQSLKRLWVFAGTLFTAQTTLVTGLFLFVLKKVP